MTRLLKKAFDEVSLLDDTEQDAVAQWLMAELAAERRWDDLLQQSSSHIAQLAQTALHEDDAGSTQDFGPTAM